MRTLACVVLAGMTAACDGTLVTPPHDYDAGAIVYGEVTRSSGEPVGNVDVHVTFVEGDSCEGTARSTAPHVTTNADGSYRERFSTLAPGPFEGCVVVEVRAAAGSGLGQRTLQGGTAQFRASAPFDSVRVDVVY